MDPVVIAAIITAVIGVTGTIAAAIINARANWRNRSVDSDSENTSQQGRAETPTLILSNYMPENTHHHLEYREYNEGGTLIIQPHDSYLDVARGSGKIQPLNFWYSPWEDRFTFPTLDIKLVNNTNQRKFFHEALFRVRRSRVDPRPIPIVKGEGYRMHLPLINIGWGPMLNCVLQFALTRDGLADEFPFELALGDIHEIPDDASLRDYFAQCGVDVATLAALHESIVGKSAGWVYFDEQSSFGEPFEEPVLYFHNRRRMRDSVYQALRKEALGPFPDGRAVVVGELTYTQTDTEGHQSRQTNGLTVPVSIFEPGAGAPAPPTFSYNVRFRVDADDYYVPVPISQAIGAGESDRFLIQIAADKSSLHDFDLLLRYNDTETLISIPVRLELFLSRLDAPFVEEHGANPNS